MYTFLNCDTNNNEYLQDYNDVLWNISNCMIKHNTDFCTIAGDLNTDLFFESILETL